MREKSVGKVVRIEYNEETDDLNIVIEVTDFDFKRSMLKSHDLQDLIKLDGKDVMIVIK